MRRGTADGPNNWIHGVRENMTEYQMDILED